MKVPKGWKLVPLEPTDEMIYMMTRATDTYEERKDSYRQMLAVAPECHAQCVTSTEGK